MGSTVTTLSISPKNIHAISNSVGQLEMPLVPTKPNLSHSLNISMECDIMPNLNAFIQSVRIIDLNFKLSSRSWCCQSTLKTIFWQQKISTTKKKRIKQSAVRTQNSHFSERNFLTRGRNLSHDSKFRVIPFYYYHINELQHQTPFFPPKLFFYIIFCFPNFCIFFTPTNFRETNFSISSDRCWGDFTFYSSWLSTIIPDVSPFAEVCWVENFLQIFLFLFSFFFVEFSPSPRMNMTIIHPYNSKPHLPSHIFSKPFICAEILFFSIKKKPKNWLVFLNIYLSHSITYS